MADDKEKEEAAAKIQAIARGREARRATQKGDLGKFVDPDRKEKIEKKKTQAHAGGGEAASGPSAPSTAAARTVSTAADGEAEKEAAAAKIQAIARGREARRASQKGDLDKFVDPSRKDKIEKAKEAKSKPAAAAARTPHKSTSQEGQAIVDDEFKDFLMGKDKSVLDKSAVKIQSRFKGNKTRQTIRVSARQSDLEKKEFLLRQAQREGAHIDPTLLHSGDSSEAERAKKEKLDRAQEHLMHEIEEKKQQDKAHDDLAAVRIQSHFKGHLTRKKVHSEQEKREEEFRKKETARLAQRIELDDEQAAVAIQSRFKGYKSRKKKFFQHHEDEILARPVAEVKAETIEQQKGTGPQLSHEEQKAKKAVEAVISKWSKTYVYHIQYLSNDGSKVMFDTIWSKLGKARPIPETVVHIIFTVTNLDLPEPTLRFNIEHQASHYTVGNLGWQQPLHDYWLDLVVEDKHHFVKHYM